jgi:hypothetical protein
MSDLTNRHTVVNNTKLLHAAGFLDPVQTVFVLLGAAGWDKDEADTLLAQVATALNTHTCPGPEPKKRRRWTPEERERFRIMYTTGEPRSVIMSTLGLTRNQVTAEVSRGRLHRPRVGA